MLLENGETLLSGFVHTLNTPCDFLYELLSWNLLSNELDITNSKALYALHICLPCISTVYVHCPAQVYIMISIFCRSSNIDSFVFVRRRLEVF